MLSILYEEAQVHLPERRMYDTFMDLQEPYWRKHPATNSTPQGNTNGNLNQTSTKKTQDSHLPNLQSMQNLGDIEQTWREALHQPSRDPVQCPHWYEMSINWRIHISRQARFCTQCLSPTIFINSKAEERTHHRTMCPITEITKFMLSCLHTSC